MKTNKNKEFKFCPYCKGDLEKKDKADGSGYVIVCMECAEGFEVFPKREEQGHEND